ncbi:MAG TPA: TolC family protein, partial [Usitatibacter sp.]|nr:TolC family protein [Usitatibacter sp.]
MTRNLAAALALLAAGCSVGPNYTRPDVDLPKDWGVAQASLPASARWWTLFQDPVLERLVDEALGANRDLKAAAERIEQARAQLAVTRADQLPAIGIEATRSRDHASSRGSFPLPPEFVNTNTHRLVARASWELDFWGKFRRATEAARADLAASEAGGEAIRVTLAADVVRGYFALEALERRSEVALRTLEGRRKSF